MALDVRRLRILRQLSISGTMSETGRVLNYSAASVSQQLALLEREVGTPILESTGRTVRLTAAGKVLADRAIEIVELLDAAERDALQLASEPAGRLRLAIFQSAALATVPEIYQTLAIRFPRIRLDITHLEPRVALRHLERRDVDVAILEEYPGHPLPRPKSVAMQRVHVDPIYLATPELKMFEDAEPTRWVAEPIGTAARRWIESTCRMQGFEPDIQFESHDLILHRRVIGAGLAKGFLPRIAVHNGGEGLVRLARLPGDPARSIVVATAAKARWDRAVSSVVGALEDGFAQIGQRVENNLQSVQVHSRLDNL